jgi:hypothetical protein
LLVLLLKTAYFLGLIFVPISAASQDLGRIFIPGLGLCVLLLHVLPLNHRASAFTKWSLFLLSACDTFFVAWHPRKDSPPKLNKTDKKTSHTTHGFERKKKSSLISKKSSKVL